MRTIIYKVLIWKMRDRIREHGPDIDKDIESATPEEALQSILRESGLRGPVYAETLWNDGQDRRKFEDYIL
jgi:hypothetical protein